MTSHLRDVHLGLPAPGTEDSVAVVRGQYEYWHYCCDGVDDRGWGCGYRTLQTLCSWVKLQQQQQQQQHSHQHQPQQQHQPNHQHLSPFCQNSHLPGQSKDTAGVTQNVQRVSSDVTGVIADSDSDVIEVVASGDSDVIEVVASGDSDVIEVVASGDSDVIEVVASGDSDAIEVIASGDSDAIEVVASGDSDDLIRSSSLVSGEDQSSIRVVASGVQSQSDVSVTDGRVLDQSSVTLVASGVQSQSDVSVIGGGVLDQSGITVVASGTEDKTGDRLSACDAANDEERRVSAGPCGSGQTRVPVKEGVVPDVPGISLIQQALVAMGDKPARSWGPGTGLGAMKCVCVSTTFTKGDSDASSKGILGVCTDPAALLVLDPHCSRAPDSATHLQSGGWVKWVALEDFHQTSFYNLCLPQLSVCTP